MELSQSEPVSFELFSGNEQARSDWRVDQETVSANGLSSARLVYEGALENQRMSRRVSFQSEQKHVKP